MRGERGAALAPTDRPTREQGARGASGNYFEKRICRPTDRLTDRRAREQGSRHVRGRAAAHIKAHLEASTTWAGAYPAARAADGSAMDGTTTFDAVSCLANQDTRERAPGRASPALTLTASWQEKYFLLDAPQANPDALSSAHGSKRHGRAAAIFGVTKKYFHRRLSSQILISGFLIGKRNQLF